MASSIEMAYIPTFATIIFLFSLLGIILTPQAKIGFEHETNEEIAETAVHSIVSSYFKPENNKGVDIYKAVSYELCNEDLPSSAGVSGYDGHIPEFIDYISFKYYDKPSQCTAESTYQEETLKGADTARDRNYFYRKKIPVIGGNVTTMSVIYEVE